MGVSAAVVGYDGSSKKLKVWVFKPRKFIILGWYTGMSNKENAEKLLTALEAA